MGPANSRRRRTPDRSRGPAPRSRPDTLLVLVGAAGFLVQQHAYRIGELRAALPAASVLKPLAGTILGLTLFGERIAARDLGSCLVLAMAAVAAIAGVWLLGRAPLLGGREVRASPTEPGPPARCPCPAAVGLASLGRPDPPLRAILCASPRPLRLPPPGHRPHRRCTIAAACAMIVDATPGADLSRDLLTRAPRHCTRHRADRAAGAGRRTGRARRQSRWAGADVATCGGGPGAGAGGPHRGPYLGADRNRLALQSQVIGAAALGCDGIVCLHGDDVPGIPRVGDMTGTQLLAAAGEWLAPLPIARGCVVNPFASDPDRELRLLRRKLDCGATFAHTQMCFSIPALTRFLDRAGEAGLLKRLRVYVSVGIPAHTRHG